MTSPIIIDELKTRVKAGEIIPFVGSGVSANLGLPSWSGLISEMARSIDYDAELFLEAAEFPSLAEFYEIEMGGRSGLVRWMKDNWDAGTITTTASAIHASLVECGFRRLYTTNYDHFIERSFTERGFQCNAVIDASDFQKLRANTPVVIKFHGDIDRPSSMVVTETDYYQRMSLDNELDLLLRADAISGGLLFLGYSLSDRNLRYILHKQRVINGQFSPGHTGPKSYLFTHKLSHVEAKLLARWNVDVIVSDEMSPGPALTNFMQSLVT